MITTTVVIVAIAATVARARNKGIPWDDIFSFPSQWFNWVMTGSDFTEPFSVLVGTKVINASKPTWFWNMMRKSIDVMFRLRERNHCARALLRMEKKHGYN